MLSDCNDSAICIQGEFLEEMSRQLDTGSPNPSLWDEIFVVNDLILHSSHGTVQGCGQIMGLAVAGERALWLNPTGLSNAQKADIMDMAYDPTKSLFGPALEKMRETSTLAFPAALIRKPKTLGKILFCCCCSLKPPSNPGKGKKKKAS